MLCLLIRWLSCHHARPFVIDVIDHTRCWPGAPACLPIFWFNAKPAVLLVYVFPTPCSRLWFGHCPSSPDVFFGSKSDAICHLNFSARNSRSPWLSVVKLRWYSLLGEQNAIIKACTLLHLGQSFIRYTCDLCPRQQVYRSPLTLALICFPRRELLKILS